MGGDKKLASTELQGPKVPPGPNNNKNGGPMCQFTDRFYSAVRTLAGDGAVKPRLLSAYRDHLQSLPDNDVPESIRASFESLRLAMKAAQPIGSECEVVASVRKMSAGDAAGLAAGIVAMFSELVRAKSTGERVSVTKTPERLKPAAVPSNVSLN